MKEAIIAIEDSRFYEHNGIDLRGTLVPWRRTSRVARSNRVDPRSPSSTSRWFC